jgi:hypothetical protein
MRLEILPLPCEYMFTLINFVVYNQERFQTYSAIQVLTLGVGMVVVDQLPAFHVFKKVHMLASKSPTVYYQFSEVLRIKRHNLMCKFFSFCLLYGPRIICVYFLWLFFVLQYFEKSIWLWFCHFVSVLVSFCCCCIYLYVFYLYDLFHILVLPLQTYGSMQSMYVCMYVCMYV